MQPPKVLLLENVAAQAAAARNVLVGSGCRLVISRFEADGRKKMKEWAPDVVILADTYPGSGLTAFCRQLKDDAGHPFRLILASSHTRERLSRENPDIELSVDGFVLRPFNPEEVREAIGSLGKRARSAPPPPVGERKGELKGKAVLVLDGDAELHRLLREHLASKGVELQFVEWEGLAGAAPSPRPAVILLGWPLPDGFSIEEFRKIQGGSEKYRPSLILLSSSVREVVQAKSPAVLKASSMLFTRPIAWKHFFRFLVQSLERAPVPEAPRPPDGIDEGGMRRRFQQELEAKFLEVEELKGRLREAEKGTGAGAGDVRREEIRELREEVEKVKRQGDIELAKLRLRETDLEMKLSNLIRKKIDAERRAQDLIDEGTSRGEEMQRALEEALGELRMRQEEKEALKADVERATIEKEKVEEQIQVLLADTEKERKALAAGTAALEEEKEKAVAAARETLSLRVGAAEEALEEKNAEIAVLEEKLRAGEKELSIRDGQIALEYRRASEAETELERLRQIVAAEDEREKELSARTAGLDGELQEKDAELSALQGELEAGKAAFAALEKRLEEKSTACALSEERLKASEEAVAGLDGELGELRGRLKEVGEVLAGFKAREGDLVAEKEKLASRVVEAESQAEKIAGLEAELDEKAALLAAMETGLEAKEGGLAALEEKLKASEEAVARLDGELEETRRRLRSAGEPDDDHKAWEEELGEMSRLVEEREAALVEERHRSSELQADLKRLEAELAEKAVLLATREKEREDSGAALAALEEKLKASEEAVARLDGELDETRRRLRSAGEPDGDHKAREEELGEMSRLVEEREAALVGERHRSSELQADLKRLEAALSGEKEEESALAEKIAGLEAELAEKAVLLTAGEKEREESGAALVALEEKLKASEEAVARLDGELDETCRRLTGIEKAAAALEEELDDRRHRMAETEAALADLTAREAVLLREKEERGERDESHEKELQEWKQRAEVAEAVTREHDRVKNLLDEVVTRAQSEVVERTRKEVELQEKLRTSVEEKKFVLSRLERELAGASEREMRLTALLESALRQAGGGGPAAAAADNLPVAVPERRAPFRDLRLAAAAAFALLLAAGGVWLAIRSKPPPPLVLEEGKAAGEAATAVPPGDRGSADPRVVWEEWTRRDVSGGVILQATLRSEAEIAAEVEAEREANGWSREQADRELARLLAPYRFGEYIYFYLYLKNMEPGYPGYVEGIADHLVLRDEKGREAKGFLPPDLEEHRRIYSFTAGGLSKRDELLYEVAVPVAFSRKDLSPDPAYLELLAFNIGSSSRRVLTWELQ
jgi:chromosome segregation ATPase